jgi:hypothetical protein
MHSITIIVYGVGPSVKILTLIQSSKATFTLFCKIYLRSIMQTNFNLHQPGNGNIHQAFLIEGASKYLDLF